MLKILFRQTLIIALFSLMIAGCTNHDKPAEEPTPATSSETPATQMGYSVIKMYPHNPQSFTEGFEYHDSVLYEGTGLEKHSRLAIVSLTSGKDIKTLKIPDEFFGEGITLLNGKIYQLTWQSGKAFVYDAKTFKKIKEFTYEGEGWGLTNNDKEIIMSNGSSKIVYRNPETFAITRTIEVTNNNIPVKFLNELELVDGSIYANVWETNYIVKINPETGKVLGVADFAGLLEQYVPGIPPHQVDVLNGIAYDSIGKRFFITGKYWPKVFEIKFN